MSTNLTAGERVLLLDVERHVADTKVKIGQLRELVTPSWETAFLEIAEKHLRQVRGILQTVAEGVQEAETARLDVAAIGRDMLVAELADLHVIDGGAS